MLKNNEIGTAPKYFNKDDSDAAAVYINTLPERLNRGFGLTTFCFYLPLTIVNIQCVEGFLSQISV